MPVGTWMLYFRLVWKDFYLILTFHLALFRCINERGIVMEFCPECDSILKPEKVESDEGVTVMLVCSKCGFQKPMSSRRIKPRDSRVIEHDIKQRVTVIGKEEQKINTLPTLKVECPKCGNNLAYVWQVQTRGGDESSTQFFRCTKCNHTFREYT
jgi:DNA-directed RNA polymerase subunit M